MQLAAILRTLALAIVAGVALLTPVSTCAASLQEDKEPEIVVKVDRQSVFVGEPIEYKLHLNNMGRVTPVLPKSDDFELVKFDEQQKNLRSTVIINGRVQRYAEQGWVYSYRLTPLKSGTFTLAAPTVDYKGKTISGEPLEIVVRNPEDQDLVQMESVLEPESVYPLQPFTITVNIYVRDLPRPYEDQDPIQSIRKTPRLSSMWLEGQKLPKGINTDQRYDLWRRSYRRLGGSNFLVQDATRQSIGFSVFGNEDDSYIPLPSERVKRKDKKGVLAGFWHYTINRTFYATEPGSFSLGNVRFRGELVKGNADGIDIEPVYVLTKPITVKVKSPPLANRPAGFTGAIGRFTLGAMIQPDNARVGDPLKLSLTLRGAGSLDSAQPPDINAVPGFADRFRSYDVSAETIGNVRRFTYSIRATKPGDEPFPEVPFVYFDPQKEEYVVTKSEPVLLTIAEGAKFDDSQIIGATVKPVTPNSELRTTQPGIFANIEDSTLQRNERVNPATWFAFMGGLAGAYFLQCCVIAYLKRKPLAPIVLRRRQSAKIAWQKHASAMQHFHAGRMTAFAEDFRAAYAQPVADAADVPPEGLTPKDVARLLENDGVEKELVDRVTDCLATCDRARYGASTADLEGIVQHSTQVMTDLITALRKAGRIS